MPRFVLITDNNQYSNDGKTCWWWDKARPTPHLKGDGLDDYVAVQCYVGKDPNNFVFVPNLTLIFTDQAEYYAVCPSCYSRFSHMQWSGSTFSRNWREDSQRFLKSHQEQKGWCEFCDSIFGNGGWIS